MEKLSKSGDLNDRKAKLVEATEKPLEFLNFEDTIHENEQMLKTQQREVAMVNERAKKILAETEALIEKKEKERQIVLQR